ncbi:MAG: DUF2807 domain-containing protein [Paludibacteraceae bacterium]|nr:DUF2807 domain-containing protein [Paludibacteraceae bacterium]
MKETRTINLNGLVYHIDYDAYQLLRDYLHDIELRLPQDDRQEVMTDIEARIAELLQKALFAKNVQVVNVQMVQSVKEQIGAPSEFGPNRRPKVKVDKSQNSGCGRVFSIVLNVILAILALPMIFVGLAILFAIVLSLFGVAVAGTTSLASIMPVFPVFADLLVDGGAVMIPLLMVALILIIALPIVMLVHTIVTYMRTRRGPKARFWWITILFWLASIIFWGVSLVRLYQSYDMAPEILKTMVWDGLDVDDQEGTLASELQLEPYHSVELRGAAKVYLNNGTQQSTILTTNQINSLVYEGVIKAEVRDSVLYIDTSNQIPVDDVMIDFSITSPYLRKLTVYGASKIETADNQVLSQPNFALDLNGAAEADLHLNVQTLVIDAKGASKLELEGQADNVHITIAGAGEVEAEDFLVQTMHINCAGASKAEVNVARELWAQAAGASHITYKGTPRIKQSMAVGGSVIRRD